MRKKKICNLLAIVLTTGFVIDTILDYQAYSSTINSAPFRLWVYVNIACYIVPALIIFMIGRKIKKEQESIEMLST